MPFDLHLDRARLTVFWCDRCGRAVNSNDERDHFRIEECGGFAGFGRLKRIGMVSQPRFGVLRSPDVRA